MSERPQSKHNNTNDNDKIIFWSDCTSNSSLTLPQNYSNTTCYRLVARIIHRTPTREGPVFRRHQRELKGPSRIEGTFLSVYKFRKTRWRRMESRRESSMTFTETRSGSEPWGRNVSGKTDTNCDKEGEDFT